MKGKIVIDTGMCKGCQLCIVFCPKKNITPAAQPNAKGYYCARFDEKKADSPKGCLRQGRLCDRDDRPSAMIERACCDESMVLTYIEMIPQIAACFKRSFSKRVYDGPLSASCTTWCRIVRMHAMQ